MSRIRRQAKQPASDGPATSDEALLDSIQRAALGYFLDAANPANGLVADNSRAGAPVSIAVVGFALSCYASGPRVAGSPATMR